MSTHISMKIIPAVMLAALSGTAAASGFQLLEQGSGLGNAYAGSAAKASDASTIFWNPAGMTQLQAREISGGLTAVRPSFKFDDNGSQVGPTFGRAGDGNDAGGWAYVPNGYLSWAVNKDLYLGLGIGAPFGLKTKYDSPWKGSAQSDEFDIKTININPSIAFRVNETVSLGAGVSWQKLEADYYRQAATAPVGATGVTAHMKIDDDAWGWNIGALFTITPATKVGLSYRSAIQYHTNGNVKISSDGSPAANATAAVLRPTRQSDVEANIKVPDTFVLSVVQRLSDQWEMLGDISWTGWSTIKNVNIMRTSGPLAGQKAETLTALFDDTWRFALGANYRYTDTLKFMFGVAYDQTPVKNATTRLTALPDNDRTWFTLGTQWKPAKEQTLELGLAYLYIQNTKINSNKSAEARGTVIGDYDSSVWILGAQYSIAF